MCNTHCNQRHLKINRECEISNTYIGQCRRRVLESGPTVDVHRVPMARVGEEHEREGGGVSPALVRGDWGPPP